MKRFLMFQNGSVSLLVLFLWCSVGSRVYGAEGKIVFTSNRDGEEAIYIMDGDGGSRYELTEGSNPTWLPDGRTIGFVHRADVWTIDSDGTNRVRITKSRSDDGIASAAWSPNGRKIAYYGRLGPVWDIFVMDADGKNPKNLTRDQRYDGKPSWLPYGNRITFMTWMYPENAARRESDIFVTDSDGTNLVNLTKSPRNKNASPSWSPDGKKIAYSASPKPLLWLPPNNIYLMNADGTNPVVLTMQERWTYEWDPCWSPDSKKIAFRKRTPDGWEDIFTINADGTGLQNITQTHREYEGYPAWSPVSQAVSSSGRLVTQWGSVKQNAKLLRRDESRD